MKRGVNLLATMACRPVLVLLLALFVQTAGAQLPLFQYAIFYNLNLEMDPTPAMVINGPVFCNQSIWATCVNSLTFNSTVQAAGTVTYNTSTDPFANGYAYGGVAPAFALAGQPTSGNQPLIIPVGSSANYNNPTNAEAMLNLPPAGLGAPNPLAYAPSNQVYLFNECDLIISNASYGTNGIASRTGLSTNVNNYATNFTILYQDKYNSTPLTPLTNDYIVLRTTTGSFTNTVTHTGGLNITNYAATNILYAGFSFLTNVLFYDWREGYNGGSGIGGKGKPVQAVQFDVAKFQNWLANNGVVANSQILADYGHGIGSVYIYNNVPLTSTTLPAVRLINGGMLPTNYPGLTVSTPMPAYIYGNYNVSNSIGNDLGKNTTTHTRPASVLADSVTILSPSWSDTYTYLFPAVNSNDTVNAAVLEGIVPSNPNISGSYSGGVENVLRYLEDWSGNTNTYNGSIVVMFPSVYATNSFHGGGTYYSPPARNWALDNNFTNLSGLPPLTPMVGYQSPMIFTQPQSQSVAVGSNVTFNVTASSISQLSYQWELNGTNIAGGTAMVGFFTNTNGLFGNASGFPLTLTNVQMSQAGNYSVQITNSYGSTNSSSAVLTVTGMPPTISVPPTNQAVLVNSNVTFTVTAAGSPPLSYQWIFNETNFLADTNTFLTLTNVQVSQAGNYSVQVTNAFGITNSPGAVLTVDAPPTIMSQPTNETLIAGASANFNVTACGSAPLSYQWQFNTATIDGETNAALTLNTVNTNQSGIYAVVITNNFGSVTSSNAVLSVFATAVASFNAISVSDANGFQFTVSGVPGFNYAVEGSSNLIDWVSLITNTAPFNFADTNTPGNPQRFYRIRQVQ
jgi:hypothetical protein